jgi:hypothetical protein
MNTSDNEFPLAVGDIVRVVAKSSQSYGLDGRVVALPDEALPFKVDIIDRPLSDDYPQNPGWFAREALCFLSSPKCRCR